MTKSPFVSRAELNNELVVYETNLPETGKTMFEPLLAK